MNYDALLFFFPLLKIWLRSLGDAEERALKDFVTQYAVYLQRFMSE